LFRSQNVTAPIKGKELAALLAPTTPDASEVPDATPELASA